jgi:phenylacetate-CoA ligase
MLSTCTPSRARRKGILAYWNSKIETMPIGELKALQLKSLKALMRRLYDNSPFYRLRMEQKGVVPDDVGTLDDVVKLPFMYKKDLRDYYPDKLFLAPRREIVRYHASSGTTGKATIVGYTKNDIESWSESLARALTSIGLNSEDVVQVANT